ncbi:ESPR-type extended signal peptide-containing protein [Veillonella sp. T34266-5]|uniref:ESPR-type extended signal peptide-containing protein n=1 Tax=Veillonella sp. T34266-5 TaxID=2027457 RepID=UPI000CF405B2|nr:ESPR-type extended signal peptide-containing protein [Veillonella sp. T34266-5]PQL23988.1 hypothetical protein VIHSUH07_02850 [Veillonella sp. T34266-5]
MNKIFKVVWSKTKECYVVVSEVAKNNGGKKKALASVLAGLAMVAAAGTMGTPVQAGTDLGNSSVNISPNGTLNGSNHVGSNSIVVGYQNTTDNNWGTVAIGAGNTATENSAVAVGNGNEATGGAAAAFGAYNKAKGRASVAIGNVSMASADDSIAIGNRANVDANNHDADRGSGQFSIAVGRESWAKGTDNISIGHKAETNSSGDSIAMGRESKANQANAVAIGPQADANGWGGIAMGREAAVSANFGTAIGYKSNAQGSSSVAIGKNNTTTGGAGGVAIGNTNTSTGDRAISIGEKNNSNKEDTITMGTSNNANIGGGIAIGQNNLADSTVNGGRAAGNTMIAIGRENKATAEDTVAIGRKTTASANVSVALGARSEATGSGAIAIAGNGEGYQTSASKTGSIAIGMQSNSTGVASTAVGGVAQATEKGASALGFKANATAESATALGQESVASVKDGVALGSQSKATVDKGVKGFNPAETRTNKYDGLTDNVQTSTLAAVSVGDGANATRQITGLAAGTADSDAVNVAQLRSVNLKYAGDTGNGDVLLDNGTLKIKGDEPTFISTSADKNGVTVKAKIGADITNTNGKAVAPTTNGIATTDNVAKAINESGWNVVSSNNGGSVTGTQVSKKVSPGDTVTLSAGKNIVLDQTDKQFTYSLNKNVDLTKDGSLTIGDTKVNNDGLTITGGPSVTKTGINAGNKTITNVSDGVNNNDAVNVSQLKAVAAKERHIKPGSYAVDNDGNVTMTYVDGDGKDVAGDKAIITGVANQDLSNITNNGETKIKNLAKSVINMEDGKNTKASSRDVNGVKTFKVDVEGDLTGITSISNTTTGPKMEIGANSINITNGPINMGGSKITNVAPGTDDTDAVNYSQIKGLRTEVKAGNNVNVTKTQGGDGHDIYTIDATSTGGAASSWKVNTSATDGTHSGDTTQTISDQKKVDLQAGKNLTVKQTNTTDGAEVEFALNKDVDLTKDGSLTIGDTKIVNDGLTITGGPSITKTGINAGNKTITNVSDGVNNNDAVNVSQLKAVAAKERHIKPGTYAVDTNGKVTMTYQNGDNADVPNETAVITGIAKQDLSNIDNAGKNVITGLGTIVKAGDNVNVSESSDATTGQKTYTVNAVTPAVYTKADGTKVYKRPDGTFTTNSNLAAGNNVDKDDVITSFMDGNGNTTGGNMVINNVGSAIDKTGTSTGDAFLTKLNTAATNTPNAAVNVKDLKNTSDALVDKGLKFTGNNTGTENAHKLGSLVKVQGEGLTATDVPTFASAAGNIAVVANGTDTLELKLNKNLKGINSVTNGNTSILLNDAPNATTPAVTIKGGNLSLGDGTTNNKIVNLAPGTDNNDAVNVKQLKTAKTVVEAGSNVSVSKTTGSNGEDVYTVSATGGGTTTASSWNVKSTGNTDSTSETAAKTISNGNTVEMAAGKNLTVKQTSDANGAKVEFALNKDLSNLDKVVVNGKDGIAGKDGVTIVGPQGATGAPGIPGTNGIDGKVGISGKDGKDAVSIAGKDGVGTIGLTGPQGPAGADGKGVDISTDHGTQTLVKQEAHNDNKSERIVYVPKDKDGNPLKDGDGNTIKREVATMDDGLKFKGDNATVIKKPLGEQLDIIGGATGSLSDNNIGVNEDNGKLKVQLAKTIDLTKDGSVTTGNTKVDNSGVTITAPTGGTTTNVSLTQSGLNNGGNKIVNVKEGTADTDAVNVKQLKANRTEVKAGDNVVVTSDVDATDNHTVYTVNAVTPAVYTTPDGEKLTKDKDGKFHKVGEAAEYTGDIITSFENPKAAAGQTTKDGGMIVNNVGSAIKTQTGATYLDKLKAAADAGSNVKNAAVNVSDLHNTAEALRANELHIAPTAVKTGSTEAKGGVVSGTENIYKYDAATKKVTLTYNDGNGKAVTDTKAVIDFSALNTGGTTASTWTAKTSAENTTVGSEVGKHIGDTSQVIDNQNSVDFQAGRNMTVKQTNDGNGNTTINYALDKDLTNLDKVVVNGKDGIAGKDGVTIVGPQGATGAPGIPGTNGIDGKVGISGKDGKDAVSIAGKDGVGTIGLTGPQGPAGADGKGVDISTDHGTQTLVKQEAHNDNKSERIVYVPKDKDGNPLKDGDGNTIKREVATMDDGLKFKGDNATVIKKPLGEQLDIIGGATGSLSDNNIGVNEDNGKLKVQLAKTIDLTKDGSVTTGNTKVDNSGVTITAPTGGTTTNVSLTQSGLNNGGNKIVNVKEGTADTDAVNVKQLKENRTEVKAGDNVVVTSAVDATDNHTVYTVNAVTPAVYTTPDGEKLTKDKDGKFHKVGETAEYTGDIITSFENPKAATGQTTKDGGMIVNNIGSAIKNQNPTMPAGQTATYLDKLKAAADAGSNVKNAAVNVSDLYNTAEALKASELHIAPTVGGKDADKGGVASGNTNPGAAAQAYKYNAATKQVELTFNDGNGKAVTGPKAVIDFSDLNIPAGGNNYGFNTNAGGNLATGTTASVKPVASGKTVTYAAGKNLTVKQEENNGDLTYTYALNKDLTNLDKVVVNGKDGQAGKDGVTIVGPQGATGIPGTNGIDGKVGISGKDGKDAVSIAGKDGVGTIGLTGPQGPAGTNGKSVDISTENGKQTLVKPEANNGNQSQRIVYVPKDANGNPLKDTDGNDIKREVATMDDGLRFTGNNTSKENKQPMNSLVKVQGEGVTENAAGKLEANGQEFKSAAGNIAVEADSQNTLTVKMNKDLNLTKDGSVTMGDTVVNNDGITIKAPTTPGTTTTDVKLTNQGLDNGGNKITNVAAGTANTDAVNVKQLKDNVTTVTSSDSSIKVVDKNDPTSATYDATKGHQYDITINNQGVVNNAQTPVVYTKEDGTKVYKQPDGTFNTNINGTGTVVPANQVIASMNSAGNSSTDPTKLQNVGSSIADKTGTTFLDKINTAAANPNAKYGAVNVTDLKSTSDALIDKGLVFDANNGDPKTNKLGSKVTIAGTGALGTTENFADKYNTDNIRTNIKQDAAGNTTVEIGLNKNLKGLESVSVPGKDGVDGQDGVSITGKDGANGLDGKVSIGKDGKDAVSISGKDGIGHIGLTGPAGKDGKNATADITVKEGKPGVNGTDGITRIVYNDKDGNEHEVATHDDGVKYAGDDAQGTDKTKVISKKLNETIDIVGGADKTKLTDNNIGVNNDGGKLRVQLANELSGITKISNGNSSISIADVPAGATTPAVTISGGNLNMGGNKITNVKAGTDGTDAVNLDQLKAARTKVTSNDNSVTINRSENTTTGEVTYDLHVDPNATPDLDRVNNRIDQLGEEVGRVGAQGAALAALKPIQYDPLEPTQIMAGYGNYRGNSAVALGVAHYKNESTLIHGGISWAGGSSHMMANAGVTWKVGNRDSEAAVADRYRKGPISSTYAMQQEMAAMKAQNAGLKGEVSDLKAENEQMKAQIAAMMAKLGL